MAKNKEAIPKVYIDSCVYIWYFSRPRKSKSIDISLQEMKDRQLMVRTLLQMASENKIVLMTSVYTKIETAYTDEEQKTGRLIEEVLEKMDAVFDDNNITKLIDVSPTIATKSREIVRNTRFSNSAKLIKPKDAIHVATAITYGAEKFYTYDQTLLNWSETDAVENLKICLPDIESVPVL